MANSFVQVPPDSTGKEIDTWTTATLGYHRQGIVIGDPSVDANVIPISSRLRLPVELENQLDYDTGGGTINVSMVGIALPGSGAIVAGGTSTNPLRTDPTGSTTQPVSAASLPLPTGASTLAEQQTQTTGLAAILAQLDVALSTRASQATLASILAALDVALSTRGSEATLADIRTALQIIDDWDESDRAKVNPIVGQAGVAGGTGADSATTQRVSLATNIPLPAGTNGIGKLTANSGVDIGDVDVTSIVFVKKILWDAAAADVGDVLTSGLDALADGAYSALGTEYDNTSGLHRWGWLEINLASLNPTTGANLLLFMVPALDGTNYPDAPSSTNPGLQYLIAQVNVATGSATKRIATSGFRLPPAKIKFVLYNDCNVSLAANGSTVTLYAADDEIQ